MPVENIWINGRLLIESHQNLAEIKLRRMLSKIVLRLLGGLLALIGLMFLEITAYLALTSTLGSIQSAAVIAIANLFVSALTFVLAKRAWYSRQAIAAEEARGVALAGLKYEAKTLLSDSGKQVLVASLLRLITLGLRSMRKRTAEAQAGQS